MNLQALGDYLLLKRLGEGSLGSTYLAQQRYTKKKYVLKVLSSSLEEGFVRRFEEEVAYLSLLDHPGIVKLHTVSQAEGYYYLVSDAFVNEEGRATDLTHFLQRQKGPLSDEIVFNLLSQVAAALDYAHAFSSSERSFAHLGLRPSNVLLRETGEGLQVSLSDFGLSKIVGHRAVFTHILNAVAQDLPAAQGEKTRPHASFLQSYAFLAPEQKNHLQEVGAAADRFAFGILLYQLMQGVPPELVFPLPSLEKTDSSYQWDHLFKLCLQIDPRNRPESLVKAVESVRARPLEVSVEHSPKRYAMKAQVQVKEPAYASKESTGAPILRPVALQRPQVDLDPARSFQIDTAVTPYTPQTSESREVEPLLTEMVVIQGGDYFRGSSIGNRDEMPRHQVTVYDYAIDVHPVTNEQFVRFLEVMGGEKDTHHRDIIRLRDSRIKRSGGRLNIESGYHRHPVVGVTWYGALLYAAWVGKRLPTEAEWEIAASGAGACSTYPTGDGLEKHQSNFFSSDTTPVMSYPPTALGLYDMAGNVYEWCYDWYAYNYYEVSVQEPENPKGPLQGVYRVLRGGCWKSLKEDLRCSRRHRNNPGTVNGTYGFRCAADAIVR